MKNKNKITKNKKRVRGFLTLHILEKIAGGFSNMADITEVILSSGGNISTSGVDYQIRQLENKRLINEYQKKEEMKVIAMIYKLKKQDFIEGNSKSFFITQEGKEKIKKLIDVLLRKKTYIKKNDDTLKIFIFDIPEKFRIYRNWIRIVLANLNFELLQKSVWIGTSKIPEEFIKDLKKLKLLSYIHIFTVVKKGSLEI